MEKIKYITWIVILAFSGLLVNSCADFLDHEEDPNVPGSSQITEAVIFPGVCAQWLQCLRMSASGPLLWIVQKTSLTASPTGGELGGLIEAQGTGGFYQAYSTIIKHARDLKRLGAQNGNPNYQGIGELLEAYGWSSVTDFFGRVPYTEAFRFPEIIYPKFDEQQLVYSEIEKLIDSAIANLQNNSPQTTIRNEDLIYGGDISKWLKLAYSLKARYAMRLAYAPGKTKAGQADIVLAALANGMKSNADDAKLIHFDAVGQRGWAFEEQRGMPDGYIASVHMINSLKSTNDPRLPIYYTKDTHGEYRGNPMGIIYPQNNKPSFVSRTTYMVPTRPSVFMTYVECKFLEAEAHVFKGNYAAAKIAFEAAIRADMSSLLVPIPTETVDAFLAQFDFANNEETAQEIIITQKYMANFFETSEAYFDKLRTGYPIINWNQSYITAGRITVPRQMVLPNSATEVNPNAPPYNTLINRVWWDAKAITEEMR